MWVIIGGSALLLINIVLVCIHRAETYDDWNRGYRAGHNAGRRESFQVEEELRAENKALQRHLQEAVAELNKSNAFIKTHEGVYMRGMGIKRMEGHK